VKGRYARSRSRVLQTGDIRVEAVRDGPACRATNKVRIQRQSG